MLQITREYEARFVQFQLAVHKIREFKPNQSHRLTYEDDNGYDQTTIIHNPSTLDELEIMIKDYFNSRNATSSSEADLIINCAL